ncbi:MAG: hypothetical protein OXI15_09540 [Chromatiales bacterium]|nr:hypothetical protein [Chromatiales bacterium]
MQLPDMDTLPRASVSGAAACVIGEHRWIPAFAGMTSKRWCRHPGEGGNDGIDADAVVAPDRHPGEGGNDGIDTDAVVAPDCHSREGGNPWAFASRPEYRALRNMGDARRNAT